MATGEAGLKTLDGLVLAGYDYDKTGFRTDEKLPGGYTVEQACEYAIERTLSLEALQNYRDSGGLHNRAPGDIIDQLIPQHDEAKRRQKTEDFVAAKLEILLPQVGRRTHNNERWPRLNNGYGEHWAQVSSWPEVTTAIGSSGHHDFIMKSFEVHDLTPPHVIVSDDDMRPLMRVLPRAVCEKPSRLLIDLMAHRWLAKIGYVDAATISLNDLQTIVSQHAIFAGDDPIKDGQTAHNAKVPFVYIEPGHSSEGFAVLRGQIMAKMLESIDVAV